MPKEALADVLDLLDRLIAAVDKSPDLATSAPQRAALETKVMRIRELKARQDSAQATRQECTQKIREEVAEAKVLAIQLRGSIRSVIDPRSERLVHFKMAPLRRRSGRPALLPGGPAATASFGPEPEASPASTLSDPPAEPV